MIQCDINFEELIEVNEQMARSFLVDFVEYNNPSYTTMWFHERICNELDSILRGDLQKLMVFMPPQHGKSTIISENFPAFALGQNPKLNIVSCSYSSDLAQKFNRKVQRIIDTPQYRKLFPDTQLNSKLVASDSRGNWLRNTEVFEVVRHGGSFKAVGVEGALTGNPVDIGIIDDPVKDSLEAQSTTSRNRLWEWYNEVFVTRCHNTSRKIMVMTRWHEDDLAGRILSKENDWKVISLPAIKETAPSVEDSRNIGEVLWPEKHSLEKIEAVKKSSARAFASLYQQRPAPAEGNLLLRKWFKFYDESGKPPVFDTMIQSWDCTFKDAATSDYVVGQVWGKVGVDAYLLDMVRGRWSFTETVKQMQLLNEKHPECDAKYVEDKANGTAVIDTLQGQIPGIIPVTPTESKESRTAAVSYVIEAGNIHIPKDEPWTEDLISEFILFPNGKHDDMVDAMTQALKKLYHGNAMPGMFVIG